MLGNQRKRRFPGVKIIRHVLIYDPKGSTWLLIFAYHPNKWLVHRVVKNFQIRISAFADSKKYSHGPRRAEKAKRTNIAKDYVWFPIVVPKTDTGELFVTSGSAQTETQTT